MKKISMLALSKQIKLDLTKLYDSLSDQKVIYKKNKYWRLTSLGKEFGGELVFSRKFGEGILWPSNFNPIDLKSNKRIKFINATIIGKKFNVDQKQVNKVLSELRWIKKGVKGWKITKEGRLLGGVESENGSYVLWSENILSNKTLKRSLNIDEQSNESLKNEKQKPKCEVCDIEVPHGHTLCKEHWKEKLEQKKNLKSIDSVKKKKKMEYKEKFEGKFYFNSQKVKSKSELLICYFLTANGVMFQYESLMYLGEKKTRPDFVILDDIGNTIILEHFGRDDEEYQKKRIAKEREYKKFCSENSNFYFISTNEEDIYNLKDKLGEKFNENTPLKKPIWK